MFGNLERIGAPDHDSSQDVGQVRSKKGFFDRDVVALKDWIRVDCHTVFPHLVALRRPDDPIILEIRTGDGKRSNVANHSAEELVVSDSPTSDPSLRRPLLPGADEDEKVSFLDGLSTSKPVGIEEVWEPPETFAQAYLQVPIHRVTPPNDPTAWVVPTTNDCLNVTKGVVEKLSMVAIEPIPELIHVKLDLRHRKGLRALVDN